jgi:hypothetical protein
MGTVLASDGSTYTTLTGWEAVVGTTGGPGPICTLTGGFIETGIILDYTNNSLDDPSAEFQYSISGGSIFPAGDSPHGVINIVTHTTITDLTIGGITAREGSSWVNKGIVINLSEGEEAHLTRVRVSGLGDRGDSDKIGIQCDNQTNVKVVLKYCYVTDIRASGGNNAYGISFGHDSRSAITVENRPDLTAEFCTADSITSTKDTDPTPNNTFGFNIADTYGTIVRSCVSHKIDGGNSYIGGTYKTLCYGGDGSTNNLWGTDAVGGVRADVSNNQSSDKTGYYAGVHNEDINVFNGALGRPDAAATFSCVNEIHDLKIAQGLGDDLSINGVYIPDNIGAFGTYRVINVGSDRVGDDDYSTLTSALIGARTNPTIAGAIAGDGYYLLGAEGHAHTGDTWAVFLLSGGEFTEQIKGGMRVSGGIGPVVTWAGNVFTGPGPNDRAVFRPGYEGYGDSLLDFVGDTDNKPERLIVQHIEVDMEDNGWSHGIMAYETSSDSLVHNCIVHGNGEDSLGQELIDVGIAADIVTTSLVYGKIRNGIEADEAYNNTVVLDNTSLSGAGIVGSGNLKNNLVLTSGTNFSNTAGDDLAINSGGGIGNISDSRTQVGNYFTDAANDDYTLKINSHALDSGIVPTSGWGYNVHGFPVSGVYGSDYSHFKPIWPYTSFSVTGVYTDESHWFIDGDGGGNRFSPAVAVSGFDTGWDERYEQRTEPQPPFIAFMDF